MNRTAPADVSPLDLWNEPLTPEERDRLLDTVATAIQRRGLQTPVVFALEMHRPLAFLASQSLIGLAPLIAPLIGLEPMQRLGRFLAEPGAVDMLIARIEWKGPLPPSPSPALRERGGDEDRGDSVKPSAPALNNGIPPLSRSAGEGDGGRG
jgi:hypothetical protein